MYLACYNFNTFTTLSEYDALKKMNDISTLLHINKHQL